MKAFAWISADSATSAGVERGFHEKWRTSGIPPIVGFEEGEKVQESFWQKMLGALDNRQMMVRMNARRTDVTRVQMLSIVTINDIDKFDSFLGGHVKRDKNIPGAISSRFSTRIEVPRPSREIMRKVLLREIDNFAKLGWKEEWADLALDIAAKVGTDDPREIIRFLDGQNRLEDGSYLRDIEATRCARESNRDSYRDNEPIELIGAYVHNVGDDGDWRNRFSR